MSNFWETEQIFLDGDEYFESVIRDIDHAQRYITLEIYTFDDDILGKQVTAHLITAFQRGVRVEIIVDGVGSYSFLNKLHGIFSKKGIEVKIYNPLPFYHPYFGKLSLGKKLYVLAGRIWRLNRRNHRKIITIDEKIMYTGSFNITTVHTRHHFEKPWKDMGVKVTGGYVKFAVLNFKKIWRLRDFFKYKRQNKNRLNLNWRQSPLRLNQTLFMKSFFYKNFLNHINKSQKRIWLMTPYFIPKRRLIRALGKAAKRGIDVRILISQKTDIHVFKWLQYFYFAYLLKNGVKVYQFTESVLHAKNYIIDDFMTIGSTNLNHRSFIHDLEVDLEVQDEHNKKMIEDNFLKSSMSQKSITLEGLRQRPMWDRFLSRLLFIFKYWF